jgi:hypothetical protein
LVSGTSESSVALAVETFFFCADTPPLPAIKIANVIKINFLDPNSRLVIGLPDNNSATMFSEKRVVFISYNLIDD